MLHAASPHKVSDGRVLSPLQRTVRKVSVLIGVLQAKVLQGSASFQEKRDLESMLDWRQDVRLGKVS